MTYTLPEYIAKLEQRLAATRKGQDAAVYKAATTTLNAVVKRIFEDGKKADGSAIGQYSTKPMLATRNAFAKRSAFKQSKRKAIKGKPKPLWIRFKGASKAVPVMEIPGGYAAFRSLNGRQSGFVDFSLTFRLKKDFTNSLRKVGSVYLAGPKNPAEVKKAAALQKKYGRIWALTPQERELYKNILETEVKRIFDA